jgi:photosystem II stability/assembly factor-like uncharacterized protein
MTRLSSTSAYVLANPSYTADSFGDTADLWFTRDSGTTWSESVVPCGMHAMTDQLSVAPDGTIFVVCASEPSAGSQLKSMARSINGGKTWQLESDCVTPSTNPQATCANSAFAFGYLGSIDATSDNTVFLVGGRSSLLVTHDAGAQWNVVMPQIGGTDDGTTRVIFFNASAGLVFGNDSNNDDGSTIWQTVDGGVRWYSVLPQVGAS